MGLLLRHNCTFLEVYPNMIKVHTPWMVRVKPAIQSAKRKEVIGFSQKSRKRLLDLLHMIEFENVSLVTLTYPKEYPTDWKAHKAHLRAMRARLERKFGKLRVVWRLEFQKRGAPHYHLVIFDAPFLDAQYLSKVWAKVTKSDDANHAKIGVDVKRASVKEGGRVLSYVCKYVAKIFSDPTSVVHARTGRIWGRWNIEKPVPISIALTTRKAVTLTGGFLSLRCGASNWEPGSKYFYSIYGGRVGTSDYLRNCLDYIREQTGQRE